MVARLRGDGTPRPLVDLGLAGGLRDWLEDSLSDFVGPLEQVAGPVRIRKEVLHRVLACEAYDQAASASPRTVTYELARGVLVDALFRQWVTHGEIEDPWRDAIDAVAAGGDQAVVDFVGTLSAERRCGLASQLEEHSKTIVSSWPVPSSSWLGRTQERVEVPLAGGAVVLSGVIDLVLGGPSSGQASVCLVELKSGVRRLEHRGDLHFYALLETLRSGAPPFRIATFYSATGELDCEQVGEDVLIGSLHRVLTAAERLCRIASGAEPRRTPNPLCPWCGELSRCEPGRRRARQTVPRFGGDMFEHDLLLDDDSSGVEESVC